MRRNLGRHVKEVPTSLDRTEGPPQTLSDICISQHSEQGILLRLPKACVTGRIFQPPHPPARCYGPDWMSGKPGNLFIGHGADEAVFVGLPSPVFRIGFPRDNSLAGWLS